MLHPFSSVWTALPVLVAILIPWGTTAAGEPAPCGFNSNNTGVWPADCTPVTTWNETDFKMVDSGKKDGRGRPILKEVVDKENRKNIVWKTPLPMYCNGGMVLGGGKLFMLNDPGGIGFVSDVKLDCLGVRLYCLDPASGKQLWSADMEHFDQLPVEEQEKARAARKEVKDFYFEVMAIHSKWQWSWDRGHGQIVEITEESKAAYEKIAAEYRKHIPSVPATLEELTKKENSGWARSSYVQVKFSTILAEHRKDIVQKKNYLAKFGYQSNDFVGQGSFIEDAFATPVIEGNRIYAVTQYADAYCYDLDGKLIWKQWYDRPTDRMSVLCSPMIYGNLMVFASGIKNDRKKTTYTWTAVDKNTGKPVWQTPKEGSVNYSHTTPSYHRVLIGGDATKPLEVLWCPTGQVLRLSDGKQLALDLGCHANSRPTAVHGDILVIENGSGDGGPGKAKTFPQGTVAFRLKATDADTVTAEQLWMGSARRLVARNGILYGFDGRGNTTKLKTYDILTGKVLKETRVKQVPHHLTSVAGSQLFALHHDGTCEVFGLDAQGLPNDQNQFNRLGLRQYANYDYFTEGSQPTFSGNRIFIRSYTDVYCLGDPAVPMKLSDCHR